MLKVIFFLITTMLWAQNHGISVAIGGGMLNTIRDNASLPDVGIFSLNAFYQYTKKTQKPYHHITRVGLGYESDGYFKKISLLADTGIIIMKYLRLSGGMQLGLSTASSLGVAVMPYADIAGVYAWDNWGVDAGLRIGAPFTLLGEHKDNVEWVISLGIFYYFKGEKHEKY